jgi:hypothetical protein
MLEDAAARGAVEKELINCFDGGLEARAPLFPRSLRCCVDKPDWRARTNNQVRALKRQRELWDQFTHFAASIAYVVAGQYDNTEEDCLPPLPSWLKSKAVDFAHARERDAPCSPHPSGGRLVRVCRGAPMVLRRSAVRAQPSR